MATTAQDLLATLPPVNLDPNTNLAALQQQYANPFAGQPPVDSLPPPLPQANPFAPPDPNVPGSMPLNQAQSQAAQFANPAPQQPLPVPGQPVPAPDATSAMPGPAAAASQARQNQHQSQAGFSVNEFDKQNQANLAQGQHNVDAYGQALEHQGQQLAQANQDKSTERLAAADEHLAKQHEIHQINQNLDSIDAANLAAAKNHEIPKFWEGKEGARLGATIAIGLAGIGAGLLGSTNNQAMTAIQHTIDQYYSREKDKVDNLFKYAQEQGKLNQVTRLNYAQELLNLKDQHSYMIDAAADRVAAVAAASQGSVDAKKAALMEQELRQKAFDSRLETRKTRSQILLQGAQAEQARSAAAEHRARAANGGYLTPSQQLQVLKFSEQQYIPFHKEAVGQGSQPGPVTKLAQVEKVKEELKHAYESGDPDRIKAVTTEVIEKVGPLLAGGRTTANLTNMIKDMNTVGGQITANIGKLTGGNPIGKQYYDRLQHLLDSSALQAAEMAKETRQRAVSEFLGPGGKANTPELKNHFISNLRGTFDTATYNGQPLFQNDPNGPATPPAAAPAPHSAAPGPAAGGVTRVEMPGGVIAEFDATGKRIK